jgi:glycosyltransferase involved in cell wall biosynthesis
MNSPLISVIIPTYQRYGLLTKRALPSVFAQTVSDQEILVIGDGTDGWTVRAMRREPRVRFWNLPHQQYPDDPEERWGLLGLDALNFGLDHAMGEWIAVLGDDDEWLPDHHEVLLRCAEETGADHVYGMSETWKDGKLTDQVYGVWPPGASQFCDGANLWRRSLGYRYDRQCWDRKLPEDGDMWERQVTDGVKFGFVPEVVHKYHRHYP